MIGLIALFLLLAWLLITLWITSRIKKLLILSGIKVCILPLIFIVIFVVPVADEIVARFQFKQLCQPENILVYDENKLKNKNVKLVLNRKNKLNKAVLITEYIKKWNDSNTNELLLVKKMYRAKGGWLINTLFPTAGPLTFKKACGFGGAGKLFSELNVNVIE